MIHVNVKQTDKDGKLIQEGTVDFDRKDAALEFLENTRNSHERMRGEGATLKIGITTD